MNLEYLNDRIKLSEIPITAIAKKMEISRQSLYLKMRGEREFKTSEVIRLCNILRLTDDERRLIFFADRVDKTDTLLGIKQPNP
ncbi:MAG: toxin-antitoxin system, antitoxin component, Xre family protein [Ruminococcus sp.]|nr:toxin-antitoxin system, antitoxin component, Xre family protein [Ruminococcus sp.]